MIFRVDFVVDVEPDADQLEELRVALESSAEWETVNVAPVRPDSDPDRQHLVVWVDVPTHDYGVGRRLAEGEVFEIVTDVCYDARLEDVTTSRT